MEIPYELSDVPPSDPPQPIPTPTPPPIPSQPGNPNPEPPRPVELLDDNPEKVPEDLPGREVPEPDDPDLRHSDDHACSSVPEHLFAA